MHFRNHVDGIQMMRTVCGILVFFAVAACTGQANVNEDGKVLYCRSDYKTGSHVQKETSCLTADELASLHDRTQLGLSTIARPTLPPSGH
jgi:hypothetical protein